MHAGAVLHSIPHVQQLLASEFLLGGMVAVCLEVELFGEGCQLNGGQSFHDLGGEGEGHHCSEGLSVQTVVVEDHGGPH